MSQAYNICICVCVLTLYYNVDETAVTPKKQPSNEAKRARVGHIFSAEKLTKFITRKEQVEVKETNSMFFCVHLFFIFYSCDRGQLMQQGRAWVSEGDYGITEGKKH